MENWKESTRFKEVKVSDKGRVIGPRGHILKPIPYGKKGYTPYHGVDVVELVGGKVRKSYPIHRLVCEAFKSDWDSKLQVNHIDGNKANNALNNLELVTQSENQKHAFKTGLHDLSKRRGENNWQANFSNETAAQIKEDLRKVPRSPSGRVKRGELEKIGAKYGLTRFQVKDISRGKAWKDIN